jgi:hypothetical protein
MPKKKAVAKKPSKKKVTRAKVAARPKGVASKSSKTAAKRRKVARPQAKKKARVPIRGTAGPAGRTVLAGRGLGSDAAGQSGDTEGLSSAAVADSESVEELAEEGQAFEAEAISGVEGAPDADEGEVRTREVPEDDVPKEYDDQD